MKYINEIEVKRGDDVIAPTQEGVVVGRIHELYDRDETIRISGYPLRIPAKDAALAADAYKVFAAPFIKARMEAKAAAEAKAKADAEAAAKAKDESPPTAKEVAAAAYAGTGMTATIP